MENHDDFQANGATKHAGKKGGRRHEAGNQYQETRQSSHWQGKLQYLRLTGTEGRIRHILPSPTLAKGG